MSRLNRFLLCSGWDDFSLGLVQIALPSKILALKLKAKYKLKSWSKAKHGTFKEVKDVGNMCPNKAIHIKYKYD